MIALPYLIKLNEKPPVKKDNFNRDSSFVKSRGSYVIHSGVHRSTAYLTGDGITAFDYWKEQGQLAINGFIEATIDGASLEDCELNALAKKWPDWTFQATKYKGNVFTAIRKDCHFQTRISGVSWRELSERLNLNGNLKRRK
jgi:hypothetical protein